MLLLVEVCVVVGQLCLHLDSNFAKPAQSPLQVMGKSDWLDPVSRGHVSRIQMRVVRSGDTNMNDVDAHSQRKESINICDYRWPK